MIRFREMSIKRKLWIGFGGALVVALLNLAVFATALSSAVSSMKLGDEMEMLARDAAYIKYQKTLFLFHRDRIYSENVQERILVMHERIQRLQSDYDGRADLRGQLGIISNALNIFRDSFRESVSLDDQSSALEGKAMDTADRMVVAVDGIRHNMALSLNTEDRAILVQVSDRVSEIVRLIMEQRDIDQRSDQQPMTLEASRTRLNQLIDISKALMKILSDRKERMEAYNSVMLAREYKDILEQYSSFRLLQEKSESRMNSNSDMIESVCLQSVQAVAETVRKEVQRAIFEAALLLILSVILVSALGYFLSGQIIKRLAKMVEMTKRIAHGHYDSLLVIEGYDELDTLGESINAMATSLGNAEDKIFQYSKRLESEVESRTVELSQTVARLREAQFRIVQNEKMAALGQLVSGIAHEINGPLADVRLSSGKVRSACESILGGIMDLIARMDARDQAIFMDFIALGEASFLTISDKEALGIRNQLEKELNVLGIQHTDAVADSLIDLGIYRVDGLEESLQTQRIAEILEVVGKIIQLKRHVENIDIAALRASKVISALKSFSQSEEAGRLSEENLIAGIETTLTLFRSKMSSDIEIERDFGRIPPVECYGNEMHQVWSNLIGNALRAMGGKGKLRISAQYDGIRVTFGFEDSGVGIPPEMGNRIFEPFFTTNAAEGGIGLGLDITKQIVDRHQGRIWFTSEPGHTVFYVELPVKQKARNAL